MSLASLPTKPPALAAGDVVLVRARRHLVTGVRPGGAGHTLVNLACLDDDAAGDASSVLWETELDAQVLSAASWARVGERGFDAPQVFGAYIHALRWNTMSATDKTRFLSPFRAGIEVMPCQL